MPLECKQTEKRRDVNAIVKMVHCIVVGCGNKSGKHKTNFSKIPKIVRFYTGLPSYQVLIATFNHVAPHVSRRTQMLDPFQEFVMVLMKLRLNVPFQDLAYRFMVSV